MSIWSSKSIRRPQTGWFRFGIPSGILCFALGLITWPFRWGIISSPWLVSGAIFTNTSMLRCTRPWHPAVAIWYGVWVIYSPGGQHRPLSRPFWRMGIGEARNFWVPCCPPKTAHPTVFCNKSNPFLRAVSRVVSKALLRPLFLVKGLCCGLECFEKTPKTTLETALLFLPF